MSTAPLTALTIAHLRGAVAPFPLAFEQGKKLTIIYGENGTGKSTICDALEFLGSGVVGSLDGRGLGKTTQYWHSVGKAAGDVAVTLETSNAVHRGTIGKSSVIVDPAGDRPRVEVLRRGRILSLLEATPAARYEAIRRFIDVSGIEASEGALRDEIKLLGASRATAAARIAANRETIEQFWKQAGSPGASAFEWAARESGRDPREFDGQIAALDTLRRCHDRIADAAAKLDAARGAVEGARGALADAESELTVAAAGATADAADVVGLLELAKAHLARHPAPTVCPLCESTENVAGIAERVARRLEAFSGLQQAQARVSGRRGELTRAVERLEQVEADAARDAAAFTRCIASTEWAPDVPLPASPIPDETGALAGWLARTAELPAAWQAAAGRRQEDKKFLGTLGDVLATYDRDVEDQYELNALLPQLERTLGVVEDERRRFTDETLAAIAFEVGRLYERVHPGEGLDTIALSLDPRKRASLEIEAGFGGKSGMRPQAYFSDSHLDTLGLCVFVALAARDGAAETILVLDDVLGSVDEPHVDRLIEMLYDEAQRFRHCVITTHHRPWKTRFRWGWLNNGPCQFVELTEWSATNGLRTASSRPDSSRLRALLADPTPDLPSICARAGVMLEAGLEFLTSLYGCSVPWRPDGRYTLGELLPAVGERLRQALVVEVRTGDDASGAPVHPAHPLAPHLEELMRIMELHNVAGCHFHELTDDLIGDDALGFGTQVLGLMELLTCDVEGWPRDGRSGSYWATRGETRRLHPLRKPR